MLHFHHHFKTIFFAQVWINLIFQHYILHYMVLHHSLIHSNLIKVYSTLLKFIIHHSIYFHNLFHATNLKFKLLNLEENWKKQLINKSHNFIQIQNNITRYMRITMVQTVTKLHKNSTYLNHSLSLICTCQIPPFML